MCPSELQYIKVFAINFDEKYNISERRLNEEEVKRIVDEVMPMIIEDDVREFLSEKYGLEESVIQARDFGADGCLLRFKKPEIMLEVKWGNTELRKVLDNLKRAKAEKALLFVLD